MTKKLDLHIEKKSYLSETYSGEDLSEEKTLSFESVNIQDRIQIEVSLDEFSEFLPSGFLAIMASFAKRLGFFDPFSKHFHLPMKEIIQYNG